MSDVRVAFGTVPTATAAAAPALSRSYLVYLVALLTLGNALSYADRQLFAILIPTIKRTFGASDATIGLLGGPAFMLAYVALCLPLAALADRVSRRKVLAISILVWSAATAWCGMASSLAQLALGRVGVGIGEAGGSPPAQSLIAGSVPARYRSTALGVFTTGTYVGVAAGLWGGAALEAAVGWRDTFLVMAMPGLVIGMLTWLTAPRRDARFRAAPRIGIAAVLRTCWAIPSLRLVTLGAGTMNIFAFATSVWMPTYLVRSHAMTMVEAGFWTGVMASLGGFVGSLLGGWLADRLARRDARFQLLVPAAGFLLAAPMFALQLLWPAGVMLNVGARAIPVVALFSFPASLFMALWMPPAFAAIQTLVAPTMRAQAAAVLIVILFLIGGLVGPTISGALSDAMTARYGDEGLRYALLTLTTTVLAGALIFAHAARRYPADLATVRAEAAPNP